MKIKKYQNGGLTYQPFTVQSIFNNQEKEQESDWVSPMQDNISFPVEPVKLWYNFSTIQKQNSSEEPDNYVGDRVYPLGKVYKHSEKDQFKSDLYNSYIDSLSNKEFYINGETRKLTEEEIDAFAKQIVAQDGLESAHGTSSLSKYYNFGGVKDFRENVDSLKVDTVEYDKNKNRSVKKQPFRKFKNLKEYTDYKVNLLNGDRYKAFSYGPDIFYDRIIAGGYATDPNYRWKLNSINKSYWK